MKFNKSVRIFADKHLENIGSTFKTLCQGEFLTDCILCCKDGSIKAHKLILSLSSSYFRKIFSEHTNDKAIFIMYGIKFSQLRDLIELIYKGCIDIPSDQLDPVYDLVKEFQIDGILVDGSDKDLSNKYPKESRDTRFKGNKRVAVDFEEPSLVPKNVNCKENNVTKEKELPSQTLENQEEATNGLGEQLRVRNPACFLNEGTINSSSLNENPIHEDQLIGHPVDEETKLSAWARKERKFKCDLCPSSFKRASHLSRHQLVHTGERPFACDQCDKAFSRHDKLKHHVHRAHELDNLNEALPPDSLYTIGHVQILTPEQTMIEMSEPIDTSEDSKSFSSALIPKTELYDDDYPKPKKGRGRPRKYPIAINPFPTVKRPRGRPRTRPTDIPKIKRPRGRPRIRPLGSLPGDFKQEIQYDDDFDNSFENDDDMSPEPSCPDIMEPLVEIKMEPQETQDRPVPEIENPTTSFFQNIGLFENSAAAAAIGKIGECTISVAPGNNPIINRSSPEIFNID